MRCAVLIVWMAFFTPPNVLAQPTGVSEYEVKAAYLYNFARFVDWPADTVGPKGEPLTICVLGRDPFGPILNATIAGETVGGRSLTAKRISSPQEVDNCRILFISSSEEGRLEAIFAGLGKSAVLTVSDISQFSQRGGMIEFVPQGKRVRFAVNLTATREAGLTLSSELLKVATDIRRNEHPGE